jgi:hypothetical protein
MSSSSASPHTKKRKARSTTSRSIWNRADDWDQLVADSALSTTSESVRRPRPKGISTLTKCACQVVGRNFKLLWEEGEVVLGDVPFIKRARRRSPGALEASSDSAGLSFKVAWNALPDHLKIMVRDSVFHLSGSLLNLSMLQVRTSWVLLH